MAYRDEISDQVKSLYDELVWGGYLSVHQPESAQEIGQVLTAWELDASVPRRYGKTEAEFRRDISEGLHNRLKENLEIKSAMKELGLEELNMGGGHEAYYLELPGTKDDPPHFLFTNDDGGLPLTWDETSYLAYYPTYDSVPSGSDDIKGTARELVEKMRQGTAHRLWPSAVRSPAPGPGAHDGRDVETINRHRASMGRDPIDLAAGWTAKEISDMAENIRTRGTEANPSMQKLKRKLMR